MGLLIFPQFSASVLEFSPVNKRVSSLHLWVGKLVLTEVCAYVPDSSSESPPSIVLLGDFIYYMGNGHKAWQVVIGEGAA